MERRMKNDLCTGENAECAMGREGYCLTNQKVVERCF
jgi:hypothetical protein